MRLKTITLAAAITVSVITAASGCASQPKPTLTDISRGINQSRFGTSASDWTSIQTSDTEFGADYLHVASEHDKPKITSVTLEGIKGNLTIDRVFVVPFGGVGNGPWDDPGVFSGAAGWAQRKTLPATLTYVNAPKGATNTNEKSDPGDWQLVIGLRTAGSGGTATGLRITYESGGKTFTVKGGETFSVVRSSTQALK